MKILKRIDKEFLLFVLSSLSSSILDALIYGALVKTVFNPNKMTTGILISTTIARVVSCIYNYILNKNKTFKTSNASHTLFKFTIMSIMIMLMSSLLVTKLYYLTTLDSIILKIIVDTCLFFVSYIVQKKFIF